MTLWANLLDVLEDDDDLWLLTTVVKDGTGRRVVDGETITSSYGDNVLQQR